MPDAATSPDRFTWVPFYRELAEKLIPYRDRQGELISFFEDLRKQGMVITPFKDKDDKGKRLLLKEIDPFTVFGVFNRATTDENRIKILEHCQVRFGVTKPVPRDFAGVPVLNPRNSWYINYWPNRRTKKDALSLWRVFIAALRPDPLRDPEFSAAFDDAVSLSGIPRKLTMGLFWIRSDVFVSVDARLRGYLGLHVSGDSLDFLTYRNLIEKLRLEHQEGFPRLSFDAFNAKKGASKKDAATKGAKGHQSPPPPPPPPVVNYGIETLLAEGAFLDRQYVEEILERLHLKKNILLQGAPGVGKTFLARKLAYCLMGAADDSRITSVQFHPSFSYEDFVQGYRPTGVAGHFELRPGPFLDLCAKARQAEGKAHVLLIDEINRGNTSQILGELLLLLEADKRGENHGVSPLYRNEAGEKLWVPENVYVIGTMNTADRSLAMVDYALRRRFATFKIPPCFGVSFRDWLEKRKLPEDLQELVVSRMTSLNEMISQDPQLGPGFRMGHSFFCPRDEDCSDYGMKWYATVVKTEIIPTLEEYWFDTPEKVDKASRILTD